jgi:hypothetical protein
MLLPGVRQVRDVLFEQGRKSGAGGSDTEPLAGGVDLDLAPYFGYNKDYLSYPLTSAAGDALYVFAQGIGASASMSASLTWEEQV